MILSTQRGKINKIAMGLGIVMFAVALIAAYKLKRPGQDEQDNVSYESTPPGPSYMKLNSQGEVIPDSDTRWAMVLDKSTGLVWEVKTRDNTLHDRERTYTWGGAMDFIIALNSEKFGSFSDWRLPSRDELLSIVNHSRTDPTIDLQFFPNTVSSHYWTYTTFTSRSTMAWCINFLDGSGWDRSPKTTAKYVRAVRGGK